MYALDKRNAKNHKDIHALAYHSEKKSHNWKTCVFGHNKCHDVQTALVEQEFNDFTDREKVTFLLEGIKCDMLDSVISVISSKAVCADFEATQLVLAEHIRMLWNAENSATVMFRRHMRPVETDS